MKKNSKDSSLKNIRVMKKIPNSVKNHLKPIVQKLLTKCSDVKVLTRKAEWEEIAEIMESLQSLQEIEKNHSPVFPDRRKHWTTFYDWCSKNGAEFSSVKIEELKEDNFCVVAKRDIKEDEPFITIPRKIMLTEISAKNSKLGPLISDAPLLRHMPNVQVSIHLLMEFLDSESFWKPYISILPSSYSTILYYNMTELKELQKSPVLDDVFKILRSVIRQYCYFFQLFQHDPYAKSLNIGQYFTYDLYRWAVSSVMTRQNILPSADGQQQVTSLVPLFDMCNHTNGRLSTDFNIESDALISYSFKSFSTDNEVCMFYGSRTNAEFFVHNGFVYPENENDTLEIKLGISKSDVLYSSKNSLCSKLGISIGPFYLNQDAVSKDLLHFLQVIVMKSEELDHVLNIEEACTDSILDESVDLQKRAFSYLKDRVLLLSKSYDTTLEEDEELLKQGVSETIHLHNALLLRMCEKKIFLSIHDYCARQLS